MLYEDWQGIGVEEQEYMLRQTMFEQIRKSRSSWNYPGGEEGRELGARPCVEESFFDNMPWDTEVSNDAW
jgi:hypothetical protein